MKTLREVANQLNEIKMINESLKSTWLKKLIDAAKEKGLKVTMKDFINYGTEIRWDKVEDINYARTFKANDKDALKIARKIVKREQNGLILLVNNNNVIGTMTCGGHFCIFAQKHFSENEYRLSSFVANRQYQALEYLQHYDSVIYTFNSDNDPNGVIIDHKDDDSRSSRSMAKYGIVWQGDTAYYEQLARKNVERYKDLAAKAKAKKEFDDKLGERVKDVVNRILSLSMDMDKNPEKYTSTFAIEQLINMCYATQHWNSRSSRTEGEDGVLVLWKQYLHNNKSKDKYEYDRATEAKTKLEKLLDKLEEALKNNNA